ncbi:MULTISPECIES: hypothetical protein [Subtercola]|uniref:Uridine kinase n=1 Tax=Subtercola vilae TaxID=2056433 RepID=A0A4T2BPU2_9MICO|nr:MULTISPECIES: hypothetical protein [Subtercola]MEA9986730.1 hypothetical protein [Subtercola sp. RTI3]TIH31188.1 hypothetical protein D4765_16690 [Subtercola vilae]
MLYPPTPRNELVDALATEIAHNYGRGRPLVGIDGALGARAFADDLAASFRASGHAVVRASLDDFLLPRESRQQRGADSPEGYYFDRYDYASFLRVLVQPFRMGGSTGFVTASFDESRDAPVESRWVTAPADAILIVDGPFLQRPELRGVANFVAFLEAPLALLDGQLGAAHELYAAAVAPRVAADAIISVTDEEHPVRVFADRC